MIHFTHSINPSVRLKMRKILQNSLCNNYFVSNSPSLKPSNHHQNERDSLKEPLNKAAKTLKQTNLNHKRSTNDIIGSISNLRYHFCEAKEKKNHSSHLSTILSEPKQYHYIYELFKTFSQDSRKLNQSFEENHNFIKSEKFIKILSSLNTLSQNLNLFLLELQIEQISEIDKWKWSGEPWSGKQKQYRQNILIQIEQRKLFYKRLQNFISNVTKELQALFHSKNLTGQNLSSQKNKIRNKNDSRLVQGDFFKHSFLTENYTEIYDEVNKSKQDYLLRSRKLKSFSLLKAIDYESNYALKLRLVINVMSQIKHIYQLFLINQSKKLTQKEISLNFSPLNNFLEQTIISPFQYEDLLKAYFNQFSEESIKSFMFMSVGYHSPEISQLNKELVDVKIRQTIFDYDVENLCGLYLIGQNQWLYNTQRSCIEKINLQLDGQSDQDSGQQIKIQEENKKHSRFQSNKQLFLKYSKVVLKELNKIKKESSKSQILKDEFSDEGQISSQNIQIQTFQQQKISFNRLIPHTFFNITDVIRLQSLIQQEIIPLMVNPFAAYENLVKKKFKDFNEFTNEQKNSEYLQNLQKLLREIDSNMYFLSRFYEWNISMIVHIKNFLRLFYQTEKQNMLKEISLLAFDKQISSQTQTPLLLTFFRMINILYNVNNHINPIYIQDFIKSIDFMSENFCNVIKIHLCEKSSLSPVQLLEIFDKVLIKLIQNQRDKLNWNSSSLLRFRIFATFLDTKLINYREFFNLLINPKSMLIPWTKQNENLKHNPIFSFLLHSDGLQKCLNIYSQFYAEQKKLFLQSLETLPFYKEFSSMILSYQKQFNKVLNNLEFFQENQTLKQSSNQKQSKNSINDKNQNQIESLPQLLKFYEENDLVHCFDLTDQEIYINWFDKAFKNGKFNVFQTQKEANTTDQNESIISLTDLQSPLKILRILSQNTSFLSSTMNLSYFGYLKYLISEMNAFEKFQSSWNYPFLADLAVGRKKIQGKKVVNEILYIQTLSTSGIQGRGRFFKEETSLRRNFMNFIDLESEKKKSNLVHVQTSKKLYGVRSEDKSIIQLRIPIDKGQQLINTVKQWLEDKFGLIEKKKSNQFDSQQYK